MQGKLRHMPMSQKAATWLRATRPLGWQDATLLRWSSWWFDRNLQTSQRLMAAAPMTPPIFIMGLWRSGTSLLHEWLSAQPGLSAPRTWHCMAPSSFAITGRPTKSVTIRRPMDSLPVGSLSPQEDEFALLAMGTPSAYQAFLTPENLDAGRHALDPEFWDMADPAWLQQWLWFLSAVEQVEQARLVIKTPNHVFRARAINRALPESPWIWIMRDPDEVWHSNMHMWSRMSEAYGGRTPDQSQLANLLLHAFSRYVDVLSWVRDHRRIGTVFLDYADLAAGRDSVLATLEREGVISPASTTAAAGTLPVFSHAAEQLTPAPVPPQALAVFQEIRALHSVLRRRP